MHRSRPPARPPEPPPQVAMVPSSAPAPPAPGETKPSPLAPPTSPVTPPPVAAKKDDGTLTNGTILDMVQAKVAEPVILSQIRSAQKTKFDLSTDEIIRLTKAGVPASIIEAMRGSSAPTGTAATPNGVTGDAKSVSLIGGVPFSITLMDDVPNDPEDGMKLRFKVAQDVAMGGGVAIAAGTILNGETSGKKGGILGRGAKYSFRLSTVNAVDGSKVKIKAAPGRKADKVDGAIEPPGHRDKTLLAPAGSTYLAYFDGDQTVHVPVKK